MRTPHFVRCLHFIDNLYTRKISALKTESKKKKLLRTYEFPFKEFIIRKVAYSLTFASFNGGIAAPSIRRKTESTADPYSHLTGSGSFAIFSLENNLKYADGGRNPALPSL